MSSATICWLGSSGLNPPRGGLIPGFCFSSHFKGCNDIRHNAIDIIISCMTKQMEVKGAEEREEKVETFSFPLYGCGGQDAGSYLTR
ncbi:putative zinc finger CCHC domain-containing protein [Senna tora]|uniref:Putative zinc finger CCHC domain-containing protein n=1 Tax=Senna tora TaxID=362788 RepID=A0A834WRC0_9FABA|nr:putative zinc finger CCHC domain-containing protein [Senna tora]